jgi:uncharacterized repeat protein (TIGR01451 family)
VAYQSHSATVGTYDQVSGLWNIGTINNGSTATLTIQVQVTSSNSTPIVNTASVTAMAAGCTDPDILDNSSGVSMVVGGIDMRVTKTVDDATPDTGQTLNYTITVQNPSTTTQATGVTLTDTFPAELNPGTITAPVGVTCSTAGKTVTCNIGTMNAGTSSVITIQAAVAAGSDGRTVRNEATVTSGQIEANPADNTGGVNVKVNSIDIALTKTVSAPSVAEMANFTFTITARNEGTMQATGVVVADVLPSSLTLVSSSATAGSYSAGSWNIGTLASGAQAVLSLTVRANSGTGGTNVTNTANLSSVTQIDPVASNNQASATVQVQAGTDLYIQGSPAPSTIAPGDNVTYTYTVVNYGPGNATGVVVDPGLSSLGSLVIAGSAVADPATGWNAASLRWEGLSINVGASMTLKVTIRVAGSSTVTTVTNTGTISGAQYDYYPPSNTTNTSVTVNWPAPIFVNAGDAGQNPCNSSQTWGSGDPTLNKNYTWSTNQVYAAGSWGVSGSYTLDRIPTSGTGSWVYLLPTTADALVGNVGNALMACRARTNSTTAGQGFVYQFDNLVPGVYQIVLMFAETEYSTAGSRVFSIGATDHYTHNQVLEASFDIAGAIRTMLGGSHANLHDVSGTPDQAHYIIRTYTFTVSSATARGDIGIGFVNITNRAMVNGVGIEFLHP